MPPHENDLSRSARRVQQALDRLGVDLEVRELPGSTRTSLQAAEAVGCSAGQIAKSLLFRGAESGKPVLVIASGANRVDEVLIASEAGEPVALAGAEYV
ncbi:MAG: YbaK/EbsC family protein, partial [Spirochaetota bacterium]